MGNIFKVIHMKSVLRVVVATVIPLALGGISAFFTQDSATYYAALQKPYLALPGAAFPFIWNTLYVLIGIASYLIYRRGFAKDYIRDALNFYGASLLLNLVWMLVFFRFRMMFAAFWILLLLWLFAGIATAKFYRIDHKAGILMLPYWLFITFAGYLNLALWLLNR